MLLNILKHLNWVDILVITLLLRILYIAVRHGLAGEFFKFLGTLSAIYLSLHYYTALTDSFKGRLAIKSIPLEFLDFVSFVILAMLGYLIFIILRQIICRFIKTEVASNINKYGGFIVGVVRAFLLAGLIIFMLAVSNIGYLKKSAGHSYCGRRLIKVAPNTYTLLWNSLMSKFMAKEKFNDAVLAAQGNFTQE